MSDTKGYVECESYKHKCAKDVFKEWCNSRETGLDYKSFSIGNDESISWRSNRSEDAWLEYPIVCNDKINSVLQNWDEICPWVSSYQPDYIPSFDECIKHNLYPCAVVDVVLTHKGSPSYFIEICHKNPVSREKLIKLHMSGVQDLFEIDAEWILSQTKVPSELKIKRWLINSGKIVNN